jgi:hypothetical protein
MLLFTVLDRGDNKPSEIIFFYGKDVKGRVDMAASIININNLTLPTDGGKCIGNFRNIFYQNTSRTLMNTQEKKRSLWKDEPSDFRVVYITKDKTQIFIDDSK